MSTTEWQAIILGAYSVFFIGLVYFFEVRLNYIHRRHVEKLWPVGEDGLKTIDRKLKNIVRIIFILLYILSTTIILTLS